MARTETWFDQDLKKPVSVRIMAGVQFSEDNQGSLIGVRVYDDGADATLTGGATGYCILADGQTITVDGTREGNTAYILLPQSVLAVPGPIQITIKLIDDGVITTLLACVGTVIRTKIGVPVVPGSVIEEWSEQISKTLQECVDDCQAAADAMGANLAAAYSSSATYPVGSYVIQSGTLYRCTTAVTTAGSWSTNSGKFTAVKLGNDVADLKSAFGLQLAEKDTNIVLTVGGLNTSSGTATTSAACCRTGSIPIDRNLVITIDNSAYKFQVWLYKTDVISGGTAGNPTHGKRISGTTLIPVKLAADAHYYRLEFSRTDSATLTTDTTDPTSDYSIILSALKVYTLTDESLTKLGSAADAKKVGDEIGRIVSSINATIAKASKSTVDLQALEIVYPVNLFNVAHVEDGYQYGWAMNKVINETTGGLEDTTDPVAVTYLIPVLNVQRIAMKYGTGQIEGILRHVAAYNGNAELIDYSADNITEYTIPNNTIYIRVEYTYGATPSKLHNSMMIGDVTAGEPYEWNYEPYDKAYNLANENAVNIGTLGIVYPTNIFDKDHVETGYTNGWILNKIINDTDGSLDDTTSNIGVTYLIPVFNKQKVTMKYGSGQIIATMRHVAAYNYNGDMIGYAATVTEYNLPSGAGYVRIEFTYGSYPDTNINNKLTISESTTGGTTYEPYIAPYDKAYKLSHNLSMNYMQIFNKYTAIGDSLTGGFVNRGDVTCTTATAIALGNNWPSYIGQRIGKTVTNIAVGGSSAKQWREELMPTANIDTNGYFIAIGCREFRLGMPIGTPDDIATDFADNADSFYGNYDYMIRQLMVWKPKAHIFCMTIPAIEGGNSDDYNAVIRAVTALYPEKAHCIDLARGECVAEFNAPIVAENFTNLHYNPIAYNYFSGIIERAINRYMYENFALFGDAPYA